VKRIPPSAIGLDLTYAAKYSRLCSWRHVLFHGHAAGTLWETNDAKGGMRYAFPPYGLQPDGVGFRFLCLRHTKNLIAKKI